MRIFLLLAISISLTSCGPTLTHFTQDLYDQYDWSERELRRIQFYLSDELVLQRQIGSGSSQIIKGEIKVVDGRKVEEIVIKRGTPGVMEFMPKKERIGVAFEDGSNRYLMFGPNPNYDNRYTLLASEWTREYGRVTYDGKEYYAQIGRELAGLMVDLKRISDIDRKSRQAEGKKIR
jgi:hypothetical protein